MLKMAFITDLHIDTHSSQTLGINTKKHFEDTIQYVKAREYDKIILGGDLCNRDGDRFVYEYILEKITSLSIPFHIIPGNHDNTLMMAEFMGVTDKITHDELYFMEKTSSGHLIFLDTSKGKMSDIQWNWLEGVLSSVPDTHVLIFMHHPPVKAYSLHMEPRYEFKEFDRFEQLAEGFKHLQMRIVCGHYHLERSLVKKNMLVFLTPSTYIQIDPDSEAFKPVHVAPLYREIHLLEDGTFYTEVRHPGV